MASSLTQNSAAFPRIIGPSAVTAVANAKNAFPLDLSQSSAIYRLYAAAVAAAATGGDAKAIAGSANVLRPAAGNYLPGKSAFTPCQPLAFDVPAVCNDLTVVIPATTDKVCSVPIPNTENMFMVSTDQPVNLVISEPPAIQSVPLIPSPSTAAAGAPSTSSPSATSSGGGSPPPVSGASMPHKTPRKELVRDAAYWERRRKNNDAAKRSRDSRRKKEDEVTVRAALLERENLRLRFEIERLRGEVERHRILSITDCGNRPAVTVISNNNNDFVVDNNKPKIFVVDINSTTVQQQKQQQIFEKSIYYGDSNNNNVQLVNNNNELNRQQMKIDTV